METAEIVLEYLKALVWPAVVVFLLLRYRSQIDGLLRRLTEEAEEIETKFFGLTARFGRDLKAIESLSGDQAKRAIQERVARLAIEQVKFITSSFPSQSLKRRKRIAREVRALALQISLEEVLELGHSGLTGERVAAGIALGEHLIFNPALAESPDVEHTIREGLLDMSSFVRYRYARALLKSPKLSEKLKPFAQELARDEDNRAVKRELEALLEVR